MYQTQSNKLNMLIGISIVVIIIVLYHIQSKITKIETESSQTSLPNNITELPEKITDLENRLTKKLSEMDTDLDAHAEFDTKISEKIKELDTDLDAYAEFDTEISEKVEKLNTDLLAQMNLNTESRIAKLEKVKSYAYITMAPGNTEFDVGLGDHIVFDVNYIYSPDGDIARLSGTYTKEYGKDCIGRYLLGAGTWKIIGNIGIMYFSNSGGFINVAIVDADNGDPLSNSINIAPLSSGATSFSGSAFVTLFTLKKPTRIEVRFVGGMAHFNRVGWDHNSANYPYSQMEVPFTNMPALMIEKIA